MANPEHLEILKKGVDAWNQWRRDNPLIRPDLRGAELRGGNLSEADLSGANLNKADLREAKLGGAHLTAANLTGADLSRADLEVADLRGAKLIGAALIGAELSWANLSEADLREADLHAARVGRTEFGNVDLSNLKGLEEIEHWGPSTIGIDTVYRSEGKIPEVFLRGAGVPDNFIEYMHSLVGAAFHYYSCFISYSSKDQEFADRLHADLQDKGVRCWLATEDLKIGDKFRQRIDEAIRLHDKLLVVLSKKSVNSAWVEEEVEAAFAREHKENKLVLFPVRLDDAVMKTDRAWAATLRRMRHIGDFTKWRDHNSYKKAFERLLRDLQGEREKGAAGRIGHA